MANVKINGLNFEESSPFAKWAAQQKSAVPAPPTQATPTPTVSTPVPQAGSVPRPPTTSTPPLNAAQATMPGIPKSSVPTPPSMGYGGANYNNANTGMRQAIETNESRLNSDPSFVQSEQQRALNVIAERKKQGLDIGEQQDYLYNRLGYKEPQVSQPKPLVSSVSPVPAAPQQASYSQLTPSQIDQEAKYKIDKERADLQTAANKKLAQLMTNANYTNQLIKDARVLENIDFARNNNPFSGKTSYMATQLARGREIDDSARMGNLSAELNAVQEDLYNFDKLSPDKQRALINEMTRIERTYGLEVSDRTGYLEGNRTLQGQSFDWSKQMDVADRLGTLNGQRTLQGQAYDRGVYESDRNYNYQVGRDQVGDQRWNTQFDYQKGRDSVSDNQWQQTFDYGKTMDQAKMQQSAQQFAQQMGIDWARLNQSQQQFVTEMAYKQKQLDAQNDPNSIDNRYKSLQMQKMENDIINNSPDTEIDDYDLIMVRELAKQRNINLEKADGEAIKSFVAALKAENGWSMQEAQAVETYLSSIRTQKEAEKRTNTEQQRASIEAQEEKRRAEYLNMFTNPYSNLTVRSR